MAANASSLRNACTDIIQKTIRSDELYQATITKLRLSQNERDHSAKNPTFQTELNSICDIYQKIIPHLVSNLQNRHQIVKQYALILSNQLIQDHVDANIIISSFENFFGALSLLQTQNGKIKKTIILFTDRIDALTTEQDPPHIDFHFWEQIEARYKN